MNVFESLAMTMRERPGHAYTESVKWKGTRRQMGYDNPWDLTPGEETVIRALVETGGSSASAESLGLSTRTVENHLRAIRLKMGADTTLQAALRWDRGERSKGEGDA